MYCERDLYTIENPAKSKISSCGAQIVDTYFEVCSVRGQGGASVASQLPLTTPPLSDWKRDESASSKNTQADFEELVT